MIEELYQRWLNHPHIDPQLKKELAGMSEKEKQDAFYTGVHFVSYIFVGQSVS